MKKANSGQAWPTLEPSGAVAAPNWSLPTQAPARVYPSSRKQVTLQSWHCIPHDVDSRRQPLLHHEWLACCAGCGLGQA